MAPPATFLVVFSLLALSPLYSSEDDGSLYPQFYDHSCPKAQEIVTSVVAKAVAKDTRMAASLIRLHFHDCFVQGCDASVLLDSSGTLTSEKRSNPNRNSARGFEVIEEIKSALEKECPRTVSCADILALAARDSTVMVYIHALMTNFTFLRSVLRFLCCFELLIVVCLGAGDENYYVHELKTGGPSWEVPLGRRDSLGTSVQGSNNNIPAPNNTLQTIITKFKNRGLGIVDLVALSGCHTIGNSRCTSFRQRLYNQTGNGQPDATLDPAYAAQLRARCPQSGGDQNLFPLDPVTQFKFDNQYFKNLLANKGLLNSDEVLVSGGGATAELVEKYAASMEAFFEQFAESMVKMGNITPLTGSEGEIRSRCRQINH